MTANLKSRGNRLPPRQLDPDTPDLQSQLEDILDAVWTGEENWRLDDRIDLALAVGRRRPAA